MTSLVEIPFDVLKRSAEMEKVVMRGDNRLYYRFRKANFYGGVITADAIGCNLLCAYCWNFERNQRPEGKGQYYSPQQVAEKLIKMADKHRIRLVRISGAEPFLGEKSADHLIKIIKMVAPKRVVIETNGIIIGAQPEMCEKLAECENIDYVRIGMKAHNPVVFEKVTGAKAEGFAYQKQAVENLRRVTIPFGVAAMSDTTDLNLLCRITKSQIEEEDLSYYRGTKTRLKERGVRL